MTAALIADDEAHLAEHLRARLAHLWPALEVLPLAANGVVALRSINEHAPEVAFLDIRMPGLTGLELAGRIDTRTHVVFVTAFDQYAVEAFDRDAVDYLLKPVTDERLARSIERLQRKLAAAQPPPAIDDVLYFQASDKYTCVMTREGESLIRTPLADLAPQLDTDTFCQIHRSTLVNMNAVASTRRDLGGRVFVRLKDGSTELPVSRAYAHLFKQM